jgi:hypothetical protein
MNSTTLEVIGKHWSQIRERQNKIEITTKQENEKIKQIKQKIYEICDHRYPDGSKALVHNETNVFCAICGRSF